MTTAPTYHFKAFYGQPPNMGGHLSPSLTQYQSGYPYTGTYNWFNLQGVIDKYAKTACHQNYIMVNGDTLLGPGADNYYTTTADWFLVVFWGAEINGTAGNTILSMYLLLPLLPSSSLPSPRSFSFYSPPLYFIIFFYVFVSFH